MADRQRIPGTVRMAVLGLLLLMQPGPALGQTDEEIAQGREAAAVER